MNYESKQFFNLIDNINIYGNIRKFFEASHIYQNVIADNSVELRERDIKHHLVNCIRHTGFDYNKGLYKVHKLNKQNRESNYYQYKNIILNKISEEYSYLQKECNSQKFKVDMVKIINPRRKKKNGKL